MTRPRNVGQYVDRGYLEALRRRVEAGPGVVAIAREAGLSRATVWKMLSPGEGPSRVVTIDAVARIRDALHTLEPDGEPIPPPVVGVRDGVHHAWIALAERLGPDELAALTDEPNRTLTALRASIATPPARPRRR